MFMWSKQIRKNFSQDLVNNMNAFNTLIILNRSFHLYSLLLLSQSYEFSQLLIKLNLLILGRCFITWLYTIECFINEAIFTGYRKKAYTYIIRVCIILI